jgi:heme exporter protein B
MRTAVAILRKDLRLELRTKEAVPAMALFSLTTFVIFHFGLDRRTLEGDLAAGVLWVTLLFAAMLGINRLFVADREEGGFDAFLLAPVDRTALFVAKAAALFAYLCLVELVAVPAFSILLLGPDPGPALPGLLATLVPAT